MGLDLYKSFATDKTKEAEGARFELGDGAFVVLARWGNPKHLKAEEKARAPYRSLTLSGRPLPTDIAESTTIKAMAEAVVIDWGGLKDRDGALIPYSVEAAITLLTDLPDFRSVLVGMAMSAEGFRAEQIEADAGNSSAA
jgi:hypothetical protein